jgi:predicted RNase H-like nuclease (RuvC/YqgF family)
MKLFSKKNELVVRNSEIQSIQVRDLKEYLVKDFEQIKTSEQIIENLKSQIEELNKIKIKYDATLITLEEFDARVLREKEKNIKLEQQIKEKNEEIAKLNEEKNNCLIREKIANDKIENTKDFIISKFKGQIKQVINVQKGTLSKKKIIDLIDGVIDE